MKINVDPMAILEAARTRSLAYDELTIEQAAVILGVSLRTVRRWQALGRMPKRSKCSRRKMYHGADVRALKAALTGAASP